MTTGLFGYASAGKTTLFRALTGSVEEPEGFLAASEATGVFRDERLPALAAKTRASKTKFLRFTLSDRKGFPRTEGFPPGYFDSLIATDCVLCIVDNFSAGADPAGDIPSLMMECIFTDLERVETILASHREQQAATEERGAALEEAAALLRDEKPVSSLPSDQRNRLSDIRLVTAQPLLFFCNGSRRQVPSGVASLAGDARHPDAGRFYDFLLNASARTVFFTVKGDTAQAWSIESGTTAREAAGKIHSDIARGFIRAAALPYEEFMRAGSFQKARSAGTIRFLGPEELIPGASVVEFFFSR